MINIFSTLYIFFFRTLCDTQKKVGSKKNRNEAHEKWLQLGPDRCHIGVMLLCHISSESMRHHELLNHIKLLLWWFPSNLFYSSSFSFLLSAELGTLAPHSTQLYVQSSPNIMFAKNYMCILKTTTKQIWEKNNANSNKIKYKTSTTEGEWKKCNFRFLRNGGKKLRQKKLSRGIIKIKYYTKNMKMEFLWRFACSWSWSVEFEFELLYFSLQQHGREQKREWTINIIADLLLCSLNSVISNCELFSFPIEFLFLLFSTRNCCCGDWVNESTRI